MVHLAAIASTFDLKAYGYDTILRTISSDLETLEQPFSITTTSGRVLHVDSCYISFVADNLAYHAVMGFSESFSSGHCCEKCLVQPKDFKFHREKTPSIIRDPKATDECAKNNLTGKIVLGIKKPCLLRTNTFNLYHNNTVDIQHNLLEGGVGYTIKTVLRTLVAGKFFSVSELNGGLTPLVTAEIPIAIFKKLMTLGEFLLYA